VNLRVPALRERGEEIPTLVAHFLAIYRRKYAGGPRQLSPEIMARLQQYSWPGNVRELENVIQRIVVLGSETVAMELDAFQTPPASVQSNGAVSAETASECVDTDDSVGLKELVRRAAEATEREALRRTLTRMHWRRVDAARHLRISYKTLLEKIKHYRLDSADS
jgi:DNA-binding NtrC family response regulator